MQVPARMAQQANCVNLRRMQYSTVLVAAMPTRDTACVLTIVPYVLMQDTSTCSVTKLC